LALGVSCFTGLCAAGTVTVLTLESKDLLCLTDKIAKPKQVKKKITDNTLVERVRKALVLVPNIDSTPAKLSTKPLPLPRWIKTKVISKKHTITCRIIINVIILSPLRLF
jgi:hypothetical protein